MDHAEARELLELAAIDPDGLDRLAAGDTPEAAALAGHLAGCAPCAAELERLRRASTVLRGLLAEEPPDPGVASADLRERTLAYIHELGRERGTAGAVAVAGRRRPRPAIAGSSVGWAALVAALVVGIGLGGFAVSRQLQATLDRQEATVAALARVSTWSMRVGGAPDARTVALAGAAGSDAYGTLLFSSSSGELVVVMNGVAEPPAGREYRCWVDLGGTRERVGKMYFGGELGYWAGPVAGLGVVPAGTTFGVSLVDASGGPVGEPVLTGTL